MAKWMIGLAVAAVLTGAKMIAHPSAPDTPERRADLTATALNAMAPRQLGSYSTLTGAKADGRTIEMDVKLAPGAPLNFPEDAFERGLTAVTCKQQNVTDLISQGGAIRYAIETADGRALTPVTVSSCSAAS